MEAYHGIYYSLLWLFGKWEKNDETYVHLPYPFYRREYRLHVPCAQNSFCCVLFLSLSLIEIQMDFLRLKISKLSLKSMKKNQFLHNVPSICLNPESNLCNFIHQMPSRCDKTLTQTNFEVFLLQAHLLCS